MPPNVSRRNLLRTGAALATLPTILTAILTSMAGTEASAEPAATEAARIHYLELVTPEAEALSEQYAVVHGVTFSEPVASLGGARIAKLAGGGLLAIRGPLRPNETPVVRPYFLVDDIEASVQSAAESGATIALPPMPIPGHGTCAVVIRGGIECGLWQN